MVMYLNLHMALEQMRQKVENTESDIGPRVGEKIINTKHPTVYYCDTIEHS